MEWRLRKAWDEEPQVGVKAQCLPRTNPSFMYWLDRWKNTSNKKRDKDEN